MDNEEIPTPTPSYERYEPSSSYERYMYRYGGGTFEKVLGGVMIVSVLCVMFVGMVGAYKESVEWHKWTSSCYAANGYVVHAAYGGDTLCESSDRKILGVW
jgi:hypothetical protein